MKVVVSPSARSWKTRATFQILRARRNLLMLSTRSTAFLAAGIALCLNAARPARGAADVIDLGTLSPGQNGDALAINREGEVVGFSASLGFRWTAETGMTALPLPEGAFFAAAEAISSHGDVALFASNGQVTSSFIISRDGAQQLPASVKIVGVNKRQHAVAIGFDQAVFGVFWDGAAFTRVGSEARGLNDHDQVVGYRTVTQPEFANLAFVWQDGVYRDLGTLGGRDSIANAISANGVVVGTSSIGRLGPQMGFRWEDGEMLPLACPAGASSCTAVAVDGKGGIVAGVAQLSGGGPFPETVLHAVVWIGGAVPDLNTLIDPASGWVLETANGVNERGQIVGRGRLDGQLRPYLLTLPDDE